MKPYVVRLLDGSHWGAIPHGTGFQREYGEGGHSLAVGIGAAKIL